MKPDAPEYIYRTTTISAEDPGDPQPPDAVSGWRLVGVSPATESVDSRRTLSIIALFWERVNVDEA